MRITTKTHFKQMATVMELLIIGSLVAVVTDLYWSVADALESGFSIKFMIVISGLSVATVITAAAGWKHHKASVDGILETMLKEKLERQKAIQKCKRNTAAKVIK